MKSVLAVIMLILFILSTELSFGARLKDVATLKGSRDNELVGYGLVIGLSGTGDKSLDLTSSTLATALKGMGVDLKGGKFEAKNAASVVVTATLSPFSKMGSRIDVLVASVGTAGSLEGGTLLTTALRAADGQVYAMAQGKIVVPKMTGPKPVALSLVTANVPQGAILEKELAQEWATMKNLTYLLSAPDFTTSARIAHRINEELAGKFATAADAGSVEIVVPYSFESSTVDFIAQIESIDVETDSTAKVIINPRTGTVVLGENVKIQPVAIAYGNIRLQVGPPSRDPAAAAPSAITPNAAAGAPIAEVSSVPTPPPASEPDSQKKMGKQVAVINAGPTISEVVAALNEIGATAEDLVQLLQALKTSGALVAQLEIK